MSTHQIKLKQLRRLKFRNIFLNTVCILLALAGISWTVNYFWKYARYEITNDAVVDQYIAPLNIRIPGYIKEVRFTEHQYVHAGDTLLILDDREYRIRLKDAEAALMDALGSKEVLNSGIRTFRSKCSRTRSQHSRNTGTPFTARSGTEPIYPAPEKAGRQPTGL